MKKKVNSLQNKYPNIKYISTTMYGMNVEINYNDLVKLYETYTS